VYVLVVEDDARIRDYIGRGLRGSGHTVDQAADGHEALVMLTSNQYDVAVVDIMLPRLDGLSVIRRARERGTTTPVLVLSALSSVDDRVKGLREGADDYLAKPYSFSELEARLEALYRRAKGDARPLEELRVGPLSLNLLSRRACRDGVEIELQPKEYALLEYLMRNRGRVVSKSTLLDRVWGINFDPHTNVVDVLVSRLRAKIDRDFDVKLLKTRRGMGYVLGADQ